MAGAHGLDLPTFQRLLSLVNAAALDDQRWSDFLKLLTRVTGGVRTHLFGFDIKGGISLDLVSAGYHPDFVRSYNEHYGAMNAWATGFARGMPGVVLPSQWMCPKSRLFGTEFYNDWVRPQENVAAGGGAMLFKDQHRMFAFGGNIRLKDEEKLEGAWLATVGLLLPHLQQAFEISRVLAQQSLELRLLKEGMVRPRAGVILLAANRFPLFANQAALAMVETGSPIRANTLGRLSFYDPGAERALQRCLHALENGSPGITTVFPARDNARNPALCRVMRFDPAAFDFPAFALTLQLATPCLLITLEPANMGADDPAEALLVRRNLTAAEMDVVFALCEGLSLNDIAERRSVSTHTVRNQLKRAMAKCDVHRQSELVALVTGARSRWRSQYLH